jgi:hypothetical protein
MNRATRAPNMGELFLNRQEIFTIGGANFGDPCGLRSNATYGAGGVLADPVLQPGEPQTQLAAGQTAQGALSTYLICQAQMGAQGSATYYSQNAGGNAGSLFNWILQQGNPNLQSETADTFTFGAVVQSPWDNAWLAGLSDAHFLRVLPLVRGRWRVVVLTSTPARVPALRAAGALPLLGNLDDPATLGRLGGEEFLVLMPGATLHTARDLAERMRAAVAGHTFVLPASQGDARGILAHRQTISLGVAEWTSAMLDASDLLDAADRRLYQAKHEGRDRVCC